MFAARDMLKRLERTYHFEQYTSLYQCCVDDYGEYVIFRVRISNCMQETGRDLRQER